MTRMGNPSVQPPLHRLRVDPGRLGDGLDVGLRRQVSKGGFRTRKEARDALLAAQAALRSGTFVEPSKRTVGSYLLEEWLPDNQPPRLRPSSYANYTRTHVVPRLGD